mgnify:CR=1 FL=1
MRDGRDPTLRGCFRQSDGQFGIAGMVEFQRLDLRRLDDAEEYLTGDVLVDSPFARGFEVLADLNNNTREIRDYFRTSSFGQVEIKCRHIRVQAESLRRRLPLPGRQPGVVIVARLEGKARMICARRIVAGPLPS